MELEKIISRLEYRLSQPLKNEAERHIFFWYDEKSDYQENIEDINIPELKILKVSQNNILKIKHIVEIEDTKSNILMYIPYERPDNELNLLLDIELYSEIFDVDRSSIIIEELGISPIHRELVKANIKFFIEKNKKRFKEFYNPKWTNNEFIKGMLAVLTRAGALNSDYILREIFCDGLDESNKKYKDIIKRLGENSFWIFIKNEYGIELKENSLKELLKIFFVNHMFSRLKIHIPNQYSNYSIENKNSCYIFIEYWMKDKANYSKFVEYAEIVEEELNITDYIQKLDLDQISNVNSFEIFDKVFIKKISNYITNNNKDYDKYLELLTTRREITGWYDKYKNIYKVLIHSINFLKLMESFKIIENNSNELYKAYNKKYYRFDYEYRKFYFYYDKVNFINELDEVKNKIENLYVNVFVNDLAEKWTEFLQEDSVLNWQLDNIQKQIDFKNMIENNFVEKDRKIFVIISDALRYEAAYELQNELNYEISNSEVTFENMLGILPSYTSLGMAALIDGKNIKYNDGKISVNNISIEGIPNRDKMLKELYGEATAVSYKNIIDLSTKEIREKYRNYKVVYIYHDTIDAIGDKEKSERKTFDAVNDTINEVKNLVKTLTNKLSITNIYITSDHGFIFQKSKLKEYDKLSKNDNSIIEKGKRYIITKEDFGDIPGTINFDLDYLKGDLKYRGFFPKGVMRFKTPGGGNNFVHGGLFLQEITIPLIKFRYLKQANEKNELKKVNIHLMNNVRMVYNSTFRLNFYQSEAVSINSGILPRRIKIAFFDDENMISEERIILAENYSDDVSEREFSVDIVLQNRRYDRNKNYLLILSDMENNEILNRIPFKIMIGVE